MTGLWYRNVDDMVFDVSYDIVDGLFNSARMRFDNIDEIIQELKTSHRDEFRDYIFDFDVTEWKPCTDDRALPGTKYNNNLGRILEYKCYDVRNKIINMIAKKKLDFIRDKNEL